MQGISLYIKLNWPEKHYFMGNVMLLWQNIIVGINTFSNDGALGKCHTMQPHSSIRNIQIHKVHFCM